MEVLVGVGHKLAISGLQLAARDFTNHGFVAAAVFDQIGNGANFQAVLGSKQLQIGQTGHGAIVFHDFANHSRGGATSHTGQVATCFGVACAHQHAAFYRLQRENVARLYQV